MNRPLIRDYRFAAFVCVQWGGVFNDHLLKFVLVLLLNHQEALRGGWPALGLTYTVAAIGLLPALLLAGLLGQVVECMDKPRLMRWVKGLEPCAFTCLLMGFGLGRLDVLLLAVVIMSVLSACFWVAQSAYLPVLYPPQCLFSANAWWFSSVFSSVFLVHVWVGQVWSPSQIELGFYVCLGLAFMVSLAGLCAAFFLPQVLPQPKPPFISRANVFQAPWRVLYLALRLQRVAPALLGLAWAWNGLAVLMILPAALGGQTLLLLSAVLGGVLGGVWVACSSRGLVEWAWLPLGLFMQGLGAGGVYGAVAFSSMPMPWGIHLGLLLQGVGVGVLGVSMYTALQVFSPPLWRARLASASGLLNAVGVALGLVFVFALLLVGQVRWVLAAVVVLNVVMLVLWVVRHPYVLLRCFLLLRLPRQKIPSCNTPEYFGDDGGFLMVVPTLLHSNYIQRLAGLPFECTVVLSGRLTRSVWVNWLRKHEFILEYTQLTDEQAQADLIRQIAVHIQQRRAIAIDQPMYQVLRKRYRLDEMAALLARKGLSMYVYEFKEELLKGGVKSQVVWSLTKKQSPPLEGGIHSILGGKLT